MHFLASTPNMFTIPKRLVPVISVQQPMGLKLLEMVSLKSFQNSSTFSVVSFSTTMKASGICFRSRGWYTLAVNVAKPWHLLCLPTKKQNSSLKKSFFLLFIAAASFIFALLLINRNDGWLGFLRLSFILNMYSLSFWSQDSLKLTMALKLWPCGSVPVLIFWLMFDICFLFTTEAASFSTVCQPIWLQKADKTIVDWISTGLMLELIFYELFYFLYISGGFYCALATAVSVMKNFHLSISVTYVSVTYVSYVLHGKVHIYRLSHRPCIGCQTFQTEFCW